MMIKLVDRNGLRFQMTRDAITKSLRAMRVREGVYRLLPPTIENQMRGGNVIVRFKPKYMPYWFYQRWFKRLCFMWSEYRRIAALKREAPEGFIIKPKKFILEKPWLQLRNWDEEHIINV